MPLTVHRFEQTVGSQHYVVEVRPALRDRWRACLVRTAGVPTALMPFYGATDERDALDALVSWLSHRPWRRGGFAIGGCGLAHTDRPKPTE